MASVRTIEPKALAALMQQNPKLELIDVRTPAEFESGHAAGARLFPLDRLDPKAIMASRNGSANQTLYIICKGGTRSGKACEQFIAGGFTDVVSVAGGTSAWTAAGLPVEGNNRSVLPLDRQVQTTAGLICLSGALLGTFVNPWFYLLSGMVGFGLTMAGLTGFCPMGILLGRMPWNQGSCCGGGSCSCNTPKP
jgi:rhodanese-related sulfurtransferase